jgi:hypothetical protein
MSALAAEAYLELVRSHRAVTRPLTAVDLIDQAEATGQDAVRLLRAPVPGAWALDMQRVDPGLTRLHDDHWGGPKSGAYPERVVGRLQAFLGRANPILRHGLAPAAAIQMYGSPHRVIKSADKRERVEVRRLIQGRERHIAWTISVEREFSGWNRLGDCP